MSRTIVVEEMIIHEWLRVDAKQFKHGLCEFLAYLGNIKHYSPHTLRAYERWLLELRIFARTIAFEGKIETSKSQKLSSEQKLPVTVEIDSHTWVRKLCLSYLQALRQKQQSPSSLIQAKASFTTWVHYLTRMMIENHPEMAYRPIDSTTWFSKVSETRSLPKFFYKSELQQLLNILDRMLKENLGDSSHQDCQKHYLKIRNILIVRSLYLLGCRISELCNLKLHALERRTGFVRLLGKGKKERWIPLTEHLNKQLDSYLLVRETFLSQKTKTSASASSSTFVETHLFLNHHGSPLTTRGMREAFYKVMRDVVEALPSQEGGKFGNSHPHMLRHSLATHLMEAGVDMRLIQDWIGHASLRTVERYTHVTKEQLKYKLTQFHPFARG